MARLVIRTLALLAAVIVSDGVRLQRSDPDAIQADGTGLTRLLNDGCRSDPGW